MEVSEIRMLKFPAYCAVLYSQTKLILKHLSAIYSPDVGPHTCLALEWFNRSTSRRSKRLCSTVVDEVILLCRGFVRIEGVAVQYVFPFGLC